MKKFWKKSISTMLVAVTAMGLSVPVLAEETEEVASIKSDLSAKVALAESVLVEAGDHPEYTDHLVIVHTNDIHAKVKEGKYDGMGMAKVSGYVNTLEAIYGEDDVLLLDGGDTLHGTPLITTTNGEGMGKIMDLMEYDAMTAGNHDFNYGYERLIELNDMMETPIIAANVTKDGEEILDSYIIKDVEGKKVGIFGLATPDTPTKTHPNNVAGIEFEDPIAVAQEMVTELESQDVDLIIALGHIGVDESSLATSKAIAEAVTGIDIIVDGHSHTSLPEGLVVGETLIVQAGEHTKNIGQVHVFFKEDGTVEAVPFHVAKAEAEGITPDEAVVKLIDELETEFEVLTSEVVTTIDVTLNGEREIVRRQESNLGNLVTDALVDLSGAEVALMNGGGMRTSIEKGEVSKADIISVMPFGNTTLMMEVTGQQIKDAIEHGVAGYPENGSFPHVSGMSYTFDPAQPAGSKVTEVLVAGQPIELEKTYKLATNDFLAAGGDGYKMLQNNKIVAEYGTLDEVVIKYLQANGTEGTEVEGRINMIQPTEAVVVE